jgi:hypothetical protein
VPPGALAKGAPARFTTEWKRPRRSSSDPES